MLKKAYVEITNVCNLNCSFCHKTLREQGFMPPENFLTIAKKIREYTEYIYLHIMGEPLLHPQLDSILSICEELGFKVCITTNGTMLNAKKDLLLQTKALYKVSISLHAFEANKTGLLLENYLRECEEFAKSAANNNVICVFRLWNDGGQNSLNTKIVKHLTDFFGSASTNRSGLTFKKGVFLEYGKKFDWPDKNSSEALPSFCMGLNDQMGVLCDGTAVPCCLDAEGDIKLGNLINDSMHDILNSPRAKAIKDGFNNGFAAEELCKKCGFAKQKFG